MDEIVSLRFKKKKRNGYNHNSQTFKLEPLGISLQVLLLDFSLTFQRIPVTAVDFIEQSYRSEGIQIVGL